MRALIVDDDPDFAEVLRLGLSAEGVECSATGDGEGAQALLAEHPAGHFDVILLDVQMPGSDGWDLLYELRQAGNETPVIFVTGLERVEQKVKGLALGADDYVVKPIAIPELKARLDAVVRRRETLAPLDYGELRLDLARRRVERDGKRVELSPREFDLLYALVRAKGELVTRADLLRDVWDLEFDPGTNVLDVHIGRLRRKLDRHGRPLIENERGQGYRVLARRPDEA